ncbi:MAG: hypothetical protein LBR14_02495 [Clostridiales Family XIII bacterium]|jgi:hypothetical protein|nr:hypothetical protein [Clostridiales Family XIII bacterium]
MTKTISKTGIIFLMCVVLLASTISSVFAVDSRVSASGTSTTTAVITAAEANAYSGWTSGLNEKKYQSSNKS